MLARTLLVLTLGFSLSASAAPVDDVNAFLKSLGDAFNKGDAKAAAMLFAEDGDLITPVGVNARGRAAVEKAIATDMTTVLKGASQHKFTPEILREVAPNVWLVDVKHEAQNLKMPEGALQPGLHAAFVLNKSKAGKLQIVAARPYVLIEQKAPATGMGK